MDGLRLEGFGNVTSTESPEGVGFEVVGNDPCVSDIEIEGLCVDLGVTGGTTGLPTGCVSIEFGDDEVKEAGEPDGPVSGFIKGVLDQ
jgi:hypothetical protein